MVLRAIVKREVAPRVELDGECIEQPGVTQTRPIDPQRRPLQVLDDEGETVAAAERTPLGRHPRHAAVLRPVHDPEVELGLEAVCDLLFPSLKNRRPDLRIGWCQPDRVVAYLRAVVRQRHIAHVIIWYEFDGVIRLRILPISHPAGVRILQVVGLQVTVVLQVQVVRIEAHLFVHEFLPVIHSVNPVSDLSVSICLVEHQLVVHVSSHDAVVRLVRVAHLLKFC